MPDYGYIANQQQPDAMKSISGMLNFAGQALDITKKRETLEADIARSKYESERSGIETRVSRETADPRIAQAQEAERQAKIKTNLDQFRLTGDYAQRARDIGQQLVSDPDVVNGNVNGIIPKIQAARQMMIESGVPPAVAEVNASHLIAAAAADPQGFRQVLLNSIQAGLGSGGQAANIRPSGIGTSSGQVTQAVETNPFSPNKVGTAIPGTTVQQQVPPTATTVGPNGQPQYVGPQPTAPAKPVPAGNAPGFNLSAEGTADVVNKDWQATTQGASLASQNIGILQNIKKYAKGAITGVEADRRSYVTALAGLLGMSEEQMARTNTDVLAKNASMLSLAGGNTDAARALAEMANPNVKMTEEAINAAADQVIAQQKMQLAKQSFLRPFKAMNDPDAYNKALTEWNKVADPRILQIKDMSAADLARMKAAMSPSEQAEFRKKLMRAKEMGFGD